jgi:hypothetical protein
MSTNSRTNVRADRHGITINNMFKECIKRLNQITPQGVAFSYFNLVYEP